MSDEGYKDGTVYRNDGLEPDGISDSALNSQSEKNVLYLIRMGLVRLNEVPEHLRSCEICRQAVMLHPEDAVYVPDHIEKEMPPDERARVQEEKRKGQTKENNREAEKAFRNNAGGCSCEGKADPGDKKKERNDDKDFGII